MYLLSPCLTLIIRELTIRRRRCFRPNKYPRPHNKDPFHRQVIYCLRPVIVRAHQSFPIFVSTICLLKLETIGQSMSGVYSVYEYECRLYSHADYKVKNIVSVSFYIRTSKTLHGNLCNIMS